MREAWIAREAFAEDMSINVDNFRRIIWIILPHPPRPSFRHANSRNPEYALDSAAWSSPDRTVARARILLQRSIEEFSVEFVIDFEREAFDEYVARDGPGVDVV